MSTSQQVWTAAVPPGCPLPPSQRFAGVKSTGRFSSYTAADTWYPSWSRHGLLSPWTDGQVGNWTCGSRGSMAATGHALIEGTDPEHLTVTALGTRFGSPGPYLGRYPSGGYVHEGTWHTGTYCLDETGTGKNYDIMGPFVGFDSSPDGGHTWVRGPHTAQAPLFEEDPAVLPVRIGAPHAVDLGYELEYSPDGFAYFTAQGSASTTRHASWISGDAIYLLRVRPEDPNDRNAWEFWASVGGRDVWSSDETAVTPLIEWQDSLGCVTATWVPAISRYLMFVTDGKDTVTTMDSYILEAKSLTGPWSVVAVMPNFGTQAYFLNAPSIFLDPHAPKLWLSYSANFTNGDLAADSGLPLDHLEVDPPGSTYAMCLLELVLLEPGNL